MPNFIFSTESTSVNKAFVERKKERKREKMKVNSL
jgi:hypothetical protein